MNKYLFIVILILSDFLALSVKSCRDIRKDRDRLSGNLRTLMSDIEFYRTKDSLSVAEVERLTLTNLEFEKYCGELNKTIQNLNMKVKYLQSVSLSDTETKYIVNTVVRDSILPGHTDTLRCISYRDPYLTFSGCSDHDQFSGIIESRDTLIQIVHRVPRKFWFIRWGTKAIRQKVLSKNPHTQITYTEYIELK